MSELHAVMYPERPISVERLWKGAVVPPCGPGQSPGGDQAAKLLEAPRIYYSESTYFD